MFKHEMRDFMHEITILPNGNMCGIHDDQAAPAIDKSYGRPAARVMYEQLVKMAFIEPSAQAGNLLRRPNQNPEVFSQLARVQGRNSV